MTRDYLTSVRTQFEYYKLLGEKSMAQVNDEQLFWQYNEESNSMAIIIKHVSGNMRSRWTDFLNSDGEKEWRNRDTEFEIETSTRNSLLNIWNEGWSCLWNALDLLTEDDLGKEIYIRSEAHSVMEAINRQLAHYPYHVGQLVFIAKMCANEHWNSLSIPRGKSNAYNDDKFSR